MMLCDTMPATPPGAKETWAPRVEAVREANGLATLADGTMERWFTDAFKTKQSRPLEADPRHDRRHHRARLPRLRRGDPEFRLPRRAAEATGADAGRLRRRRPRHAARRQQRIAELVPGGRYEEIADARHMPNIEHPDTFNRIMLGWLEARR